MAVHERRRSLAGRAFGPASDTAFGPNVAEGEELHNSQPWRWLLRASSVHLVADRTRFTPWEVLAAHLDLLVRRAGRAGALLVPVIDSATRWLLTRAIETTARRQADNPDYRTELAAWSRSSFAPRTAYSPPPAEDTVGHPGEVRSLGGTSSS